jgi:hypothetical protein
MAVGDSRYYRIKGIQHRHFYQTAQKAGVAKQDMNDLFADILSRATPAIGQMADAARQACRKGQPTAFSPGSLSERHRLRTISPKN